MWPFTAGTSSPADPSTTHSVPPLAAAPPIAHKQHLEQNPRQLINTQFPPSSLPHTPSIPISTSSDATHLAPSSTAPSLPTSPDHPRLSLAFPMRLALSSSLSATLGIIIGSSHGARESALRFLAENAHRLPTSTSGWYLYHKKKNYVVMLGGLREGRRMGVKLGLWTGLFFSLEEGMDRVRARVSREYRRSMAGGGRGGFEDGVMAGRKEFGDDVVAGRKEFEENTARGRVEGSGRDVGSSLFAGAGTALAFAAWERLNWVEGHRVVRIGALAGLGFGFVQDAARVLEGRRVGYVDGVRWILGLGRKEELG